MSMYRTRYFVTYPGVPEQEIGLAGWCEAERAAGFHGPEGHAATGGFSGHGISGRMEFTTRTPQEQPLQPSRRGEHELELRDQYRYATDEPDEMSALINAIDLASDQNQVTWLTRDGQRIAALVPADVAEDHERRIAEALTIPAGRKIPPADEGEQSS